MTHINILTIHNEPNYGALLQAFALYHTIEGMGYRPRMIDLHLQYRSRAYNPINRILVNAHNLLKGYNFCYNKAHKFSKMHEPNKVGPFFSYEQLQEYDAWNSDDMFLIGSDQVWNSGITHMLKDAYTFKFLPEECRNRYSYAASFGNIKNEAQRMADLDVSNTLTKFKQIGIRETFGKEFLAKCDICSTVVVDPTLLLDDYSALVEGAPKPSGNLLYLSLGEAPKMDAFAEDVSRKYNLPIELRYGYLQPSRAINKKWLSVGQWLNRIASAEVVVTDSFHATVFAIQFERPFYVYISEPSKAFRITNILGMLGLEDRIVSDITQVDLKKSVDYTNVKKKLGELRADSLSFLRNMLKDYESSNM